MTDHPQMTADAKSAEIAKLVKQLRKAEQRLQELNGNGVDAVLYPGGQAYMLQAMQERLRLSEERYRTLVEWSREAISVQRHGELLFVNPAAIKMMGGTSASDLIGKSIRDMVHPDSRPIVCEQHNRMADGSDLLPMMEEKLIRLDGATIDVEVQSMPITYEGKPALLGSMRDITEQKRIEGRFRRLTDSNAQCIFFWHIDGAITGCNDAFLSLLGYTRKNLEAGLSWAEMTPKEYAADDQRAMRAVVANGTCPTYEKEFISNHGTRVPIIIGAAVFEDNPDEGVCFVLDLTERKKLEQQLRQSQKMELLGQLTGGIAHDFNNLLSIVQLNLELIRERLSRDREADEMVGMALDAVERGASLTHQLLAYARKQPLEPKTVDLKSLVSDMTTLLRRTLGEAIAIETIMPLDLWPVRIDPHQLENALLNLAVNSRHAMPDGGKLIIEAYNTKFDEMRSLPNPDLRGSDYVTIAVSDTGVGMSPEILEQALEPFFTTKPIGKGSGLGLSMVLGFAAQSGGHLKISSAAGFGTTVRLDLPRASIDDVQLIQGRRHEASMSKPDEVILVVEDDQFMRGLTVRVLTGLGYRTIEADDGPAACQILEHTGPIDLLLTDIMLPNGMNGRELAQWVRSRRPDVKVLYMSGYPGDAVGGGLGSHTQLLSKPFSKGDLARMVHDVLGATNAP
jgi:PAS domain S-box-containing protein